jgi:hypothetical protein
VTQEHLQEFTDRHLALVLDKIFTAEEIIALYDGVQKENPQSLQKLIKASSKEDRLKAFVDGLLPVHKHAGEVLLWLVKKKHIRTKNLETWKLKYKGQSAEAVARRIITQYRPSPEELQKQKRPHRGKTGDPSHGVDPSFREADRPNIASGYTSSIGTGPANRDDLKHGGVCDDDSTEINTEVMDHGLAWKSGGKVSFHFFYSYRTMFTR